VVDLDLALTDPVAAQVNNLVEKFEGATVFAAFTKGIV
jgi:hypothetical protein